MLVKKLFRLGHHLITQSISIWRQIKSAWEEILGITRHVRYIRSGLVCDFALKNAFSWVDWLKLTSKDFPLACLLFLLVHWIWHSLSWWDVMFISLSRILERFWCIFLCHCIGLLDSWSAFCRLCYWHSHEAQWFHLWIIFVS